jgi:hypothetical protein
MIYETSHSGEFFGLIGDYANESAVKSHGVCNVFFFLLIQEAWKEAQGSAHQG